MNRLGKPIHIDVDRDDPWGRVEHSVEDAVNDTITHSTWLLVSDSIDHAVWRAVGDEMWTVVKVKLEDMSYG